MRHTDPGGPRVLELTEWADEPFAGVRLTESTRALAARLAAQHERRIELIETLDGLRMRTFSWVGVVRLDDVEIRVIPKLAGDPRTLARMIEWTTRASPLRTVCGGADLDVVGSHLLDLARRAQ